MAPPLSSEQSPKLPPQESPPASSALRDDIPKDLPAAFAALVAAKDKQACVKMLDEHRDGLTRPESVFHWLVEPFKMGLTCTEIVDILIEEAEERPWIRYNIPIPDKEPRRRIAKFCGLGGIIPILDGPQHWKDKVEFQSDDRVASISYGSRLRSEESIEWVDEVLQDCLSALDRLVELIQWLQLRKLAHGHIEVYSINPQNQVEASRVPFNLIQSLRDCVAATLALKAHENRTSYHDEISGMAADILRLVHSFPVSSVPLRRDIDTCALAVQMLCIGILSFGQDHIGELDSCFLMGPLSQVVLHGASQMPGNASENSLFFQRLKVNRVEGLNYLGTLTFADRFVESDETFDLHIMPNDFLGHQGPGITF
jgi:hypothetical protein